MKSPRKPSTKAAALRAALERAEAERQRRAGADSGVKMFITGVPRSSNWGKWKPNADAYRKPSAFIPASEPKPQQAAPQQLAPKVSEWRRVWATVRRPNPERNDPGEIREGWYRTEDQLLHVQDDRGNSLRRDRLQPGDNIDAAARKILRETHDHHGAFYAPINYPRRTVH